MPSKHTPTPYKVSDIDTVTLDLYMLKAGYHPEAREAVLRAVNAHEELIEALRTVRDWFAPTADGGYTDPHDAKVYQFVKQAIAKAEGPHA